MKKIFLIMVAMLSMAIVACESDKNTPAPPAVEPTFDLIDAQPNVTSVLLQATIEVEANASVEQVGFSYRVASDQYTDVVSSYFENDLARQTLTGLTAETTYNWYCYAVVDGERYNSSVRTFTTLREGEVPSPQPTFNLIDAQPDVKSAVVAATISVQTGYVIDQAGFSYKAASGQYVDVVSTYFEEGLARQTLTGLTPETTYDWYCYVVIDGERFNSSSRTFTTLKEGDVPTPKPTFGTPTASNVGITTATITSSYLYEGTFDVEEAGLSYKKVSDQNYVRLEADSYASPLTFNLSGLSPETQYQFFTYVMVDGEFYNSEVITFTTQKDTPAPDLPEFTCRLLPMLPLIRLRSPAFIHIQVR